MTTLDAYRLTLMVGRSALGGMGGRSCFVVEHA